MNRKKIHFRAACVLAGLAVALTMGCDALDSFDGGSSPSEPVTILPGGQCRVVGRSIECEDESRSLPPNQLELIEWTLRSATSGDRIESRTGGPDDEVSFPGLASDTYQVTQRVNAKDGGFDQRIHNGLTVQ